MTLLTCHKSKPLNKISVQIQLTPMCSMQSTNFITLNELREPRRLERSAELYTHEEVVTRTLDVVPMLPHQRRKLSVMTLGVQQCMKQNRLS